MVLHIFIQSILNTRDVKKMTTDPVTQGSAILLGGNHCTADGRTGEHRAAEQEFFSGADAEKASTSGQARGTEAGGCSKSVSQRQPLVLK